MCCCILSCYGSRLKTCRLAKAGGRAKSGGAAYLDICISAYLDICISGYLDGKIWRQESARQTSASINVSGRLLCNSEQKDIRIIESLICNHLRPLLFLAIRHINVTKHKTNWDQYTCTAVWWVQQRSRWDSRVELGDIKVLHLIYSPLLI